MLRDVAPEEWALEQVKPPCNERQTMLMKPRK